MFFSFLLSFTQLNFNHTKLLTTKGHLLPLSQNNDQAEEQCDCQYGISTVLCPFLLSTFHLRAHHSCDIVSKILFLLCAKPLLVLCTNTISADR